MESLSASAGDMTPRGGSYQPSEEEAALIKATERFFNQARSDRRVFEQQWFVNVAMERGQHYLEWNDKFQRLTVPSAPPHRIRIKDNRLQAKNRARTAKFLKNRPKTVVVPATNEYDDYLNARGTQKTLDCLFRKGRMAQKLQQMLELARTQSKGFLWFHWDESIMGRVMIKDPMTGQASYQEAPLGDPTFEIGTSFEIFVKDPATQRIGDQPEILRVKLREVADMKQRYPEFADWLVPSSKDQEAFRYERQIATLNPLGLGTNPVSKSADSEDHQQVLVKEHFIRPCAKYPKGHYRVLVGNVLVKKEDSLPFGFSDLANPFPVIEIADTRSPGQFWNPTVMEQAIDIQKHLNLMLSKVAEHVRLMAFPKILVSKQHQLGKSQWTSEAGEIIEYVGHQGLEAPKPWHPPPVLGDVWRLIEYLSQEFDNIYQIWPVSEGGAGGTTSGFQANLLQEAANTVHGLDMRGLEEALEEWAQKTRRMVKLGYDVPRLIALTGPNYEPEVLEFSASQIDETADIVVEVGSGLSELRSQRQELVMQLYNSGLMGDVADPEVRRRTLGLLELGSVEAAFNLAKQDENQAGWENIQLVQAPPPPPQEPQLDEMGMPMMQMDPMTGQPIPIMTPYQPPIEDPHFYENHLIHYNIHTMWLKSPEGRSASPPHRYAMTRHTVLHGKYINPQAALQLATEEGIQDLIPVLQQLVMSMAPPVPPEGAPPSGPPPA